MASSILMAISVVVISIRSYRNENTKIGICTAWIDSSVYADIIKIITKNGDKNGKSFQDWCDVEKWPLKNIQQYVCVFDDHLTVEYGNGFHHYGIVFYLENAVAKPDEFTDETIINSNIVYYNENKQ